MKSKAAESQVWPGIGIHAIDMVQEPGIGIPAQQGDEHIRIVSVARQMKAAAQMPRNSAWGRSETLFGTARQGSICDPARFTVLHLVFSTMFNIERRTAVLAK